MKIMTGTAARADLFNLIAQTRNHEPIMITGKKNNAVLISEDDWNEIQESLYVALMPQLKEQIEEEQLRNPEKGIEFLDILW